METKAYIKLAWLALFTILFACNESNRFGDDSNIDQQDVLLQEEEVKTTMGEAFSSWGKSTRIFVKEKGDGYVSMVVIHCCLRLSPHS